MITSQKASWQTQLRARAFLQVPGCCRQRQQYRASSRLPQPVSDLVVKGLRIVRLHDSRVITQAIEELRPVGPVTEFPCAGC
jgi:hypothetical protein